MCNACLYKIKSLVYKYYLYELLLIVVQDSKWLIFISTSFYVHRTALIQSSMHDLYDLLLNYYCSQP